MRLDLSATSQKKIGYIPYAICIEFTDNEQNHHKLSMDLRGTTDCNSSSLNTVTKGQLIPWTHIQNKHAFGLGELSENEHDPYLKLFNDHLKTATQITVVVHAIDDEFEVDSYDDILTDMSGSYEYIDEENNTQKIPFTFTYKIV